MTSDSTSGKGKASSPSADGQYLSDSQSRENQLLQYLKEKAIETAEFKFQEKMMMSPRSGSTGARADSSQGEPKKVDNRFISPKSMLEASILDDALESTRAHYMDLVGEPAPSSPPFENYVTQWRFIQDQLDAHWFREEYPGQPPKLFILGAWSGALGNWKYLKGQDITGREN